jgi:hypothetical protein
VLVPLRDEQIRDEVPAQYEEDIYPEKSPRKHGQLLMKGDNGDNGERPTPSSPGSRVTADLTRVPLLACSVTIALFPPANRNDQIFATALQEETPR